MRPCRALSAEVYRQAAAMRLDVVVSRSAVVPSFRSMPDSLRNWLC